MRRPADNATSLATRQAAIPLPSIVIAAGDAAAERFINFFAAQIRNPNTRRAYATAVARFLRWCEQKGIGLTGISTFAVAAYVESLGSVYAKPTVKQHLAAIRVLLDWLVVGQVIPSNPAAPVRGPKHTAKKGKTPVLSAVEARQLLDSIDTGRIVGMRDRALIAVMVFTFARVSAAVGMNVEDCFLQGRRLWFRLHEKGGKRHEVPAHHKADEYVHAYLEAAGISDQKKSPLFRSVDRSGRLTDRRLSRHRVLEMVKRRARQAELPETIGCHTFRATGITAYLEGGGTLEHAQQIAAHESARTTKLCLLTRICG